MKIALVVVGSVTPVQVLIPPSRLTVAVMICSSASSQTDDGAFMLTSGVGNTVMDKSVEVVQPFRVYS